MRAGPAHWPVRRQFQPAARWPSHGQPHRRCSGLQLDKVWWLISPGNPLKDTRGLPSVEDRMEAARQLAAHPRIVVTGFEATLGSPYTCDTVDALVTRCRAVHFVWLMGADSFADFHLWKNWRTIADRLPLAIIDRPGSTLRAARTPAAAFLADARLDEGDAALLRWRSRRLTSSCMASARRCLRPSCARRARTPERVSGGSRAPACRLSRPALRGNGALLDHLRRR